MLTTTGIRIIRVPIVLVLECVCYYGAVKKKPMKQTVTSRIAQWGTYIPVGTGFGNLETSYNVKCNRFSTTGGEGTVLTVQEVLEQMYNRTYMLTS